MNFLDNIFPPTKVVHIPGMPIVANGAGSEGPFSLIVQHCAGCGKELVCEFTTDDVDLVEWAGPFILRPTQQQGEGVSCFAPWTIKKRFEEKGIGDAQQN